MTQKLTCNHNSKIAVKIEGNCLNQDKTSFTHRNVVNFFVYELDIWSHDLRTEFILKDYLFGAFKLTKNVDLDKYFYSGYGIGFD